MKTLRVMMLVASCAIVAPALAQTAGGTQNSGPQGTGNFVAGKPEGPRQLRRGQAPEGHAEALRLKSQQGDQLALQGDRGSPPRRHVAKQSSPAAGVSLPPGQATIGGWGLINPPRPTKLSHTNVAEILP